MKGDQGDFASRLRLVLPEGWFRDGAPVLGGVLAGLGAHGRRFTRCCRAFAWNRV